MTREEQVKKYAPEVFGVKTSPYIKPFMDGIKFADEHPLNPWISVKERKPEAVEQKEFGYRRLSKQVLCVYEDGKCHVERYDHNCNCWRWANGYGQMYEPKMWRYIDTPKLSNN